MDAWQEVVSETMAHALPEFSPVASRVRGEERGLMKFQWVPKKSLICGVSFRPLDDAFDVWIGWSVDGRFPYLGAQRVAPSPSEIWDFERVAVVVPAISLSGRVGSAAWNLWEPTEDQVNDPEAFAKAFVEYTSRSMSPQEARGIVMPLVARAVSEVKDYGLPYLHRRADNHE